MEHTSRQRRNEPQTIQLRDPVLAQIRRYVLAAATLLFVTHAQSAILAQAVRVRVANVCGSGSICGYDASGAYILTNAHVAGTTIGRTCNIDYQSQAGQITTTARVIMAAYSDSTLTDWAILQAQSLTGGPSWKLSTKRPTDTQTAFNTCGSPRCVWPLICTSVQTDNHSATPWTWTPNSIPGQSGSSVRTPEGVTYGLLTWSWNGRGAGQQTATIYAQATQRSIDAAPRPEGLIEVPTQAQTQPPPPIATNPRAYTANGFFSIARSVNELPIWQDETPPPDNDAETRAKQQVREMGWDWVKFIELVILILRFIQSQQPPTIA